MYGWTDPMDPNGAPRRAEGPTDEPAWLHDRPEPRSAYLFGDEPGQPGDDWHREQPAGGLQSEPATPAEPADAHSAAWPAYQPEGEAGGWDDSRPAQDSTGVRRAETPGGWHTDTDPETTDGWRGAAETGRSGEGRHRSPRRWRRPLMIGGAAAAATLVVSFGVGALTLPGGDDGAAQPTAVDDSFAASAVPTDEPVLDTLAAPWSPPSPARRPRARRRPRSSSPRRRRRGAPPPRAAASSAAARPATPAAPPDPTAPAAPAAPSAPRPRRWWTWSTPSGPRPAARR